MKLKIIDEWREVIQNARMICIIDDEGDIIQGEDLYVTLVETTDCGEKRRQPVTEETKTALSEKIKRLYIKVKNMHGYQIVSKPESLSLEVDFIQKKCVIIDDELGIDLFGEYAFFVPIKRESGDGC